VNHLREILGIPSVLMGFALPDDGLHAPNEKFHLPTFFKAIATSIHFLTEVAGIGRQASRDTSGRLALPQSHDHKWAAP
jgi:hypothetical protein